MNTKILQIFSIFLLSIFIIGCNGEEDCNCPSPVPTDVNKTISEANFQEGLITKETTLEVKTADNEILTLVTLQEGTQFEDANGVAITEIPILSVNVIRKNRTSISTIKFFDKNGNALVPTKPVKLAIQPPLTANAGDQIQLNVADNSNIQIQKTIIRIVDENGLILIEVVFNDNQNATLIITASFLGNGATN